MFLNVFTGVLSFPLWRRLCLLLYGLAAILGPGILHANTGSPSDKQGMQWVNILMNQPLMAATLSSASSSSVKSSPSQEAFSFQDREALIHALKNKKEREQLIARLSQLSETSDPPSLGGRLIHEGKSFVQAVGQKLKALPQESMQLKKECQLLLQRISKVDPRFTLFFSLWGLCLGGGYLAEMLLRRMIRNKFLKSEGRWQTVTSAYAKVGIEWGPLWALAFFSLGAHALFSWPTPSHQQLSFVGLSLFWMGRLVYQASKQMKVWSQEQEPLLLKGKRKSFWRPHRVLVVSFLQTFSPLWATTIGGILLIGVAQGASPLIRGWQWVGLLILNVPLGLLSHKIFLKIIDRFPKKRRPLFWMTRLLSPIVLGALGSWYGLYWVFMVLSLALEGLGLRSYALFFWISGHLTSGWILVLPWVMRQVDRAVAWIRRTDGFHHQNAKWSLPLSPYQLRDLLYGLLQALFLWIWFEIWGLSPFQSFSLDSFPAPLRNLIIIGMILVTWRGVWITVNYLTDMFLYPRRSSPEKTAPTLFTKTIAPIARSVAHWTLAITGVIFILEAMGLPIMPIIYGIGVMGIAFSLGAQSLVKDLINGVLTLMEGNIAVGETVRIGAYAGVVESLSLRGVSLRHANGALQTLPFSEVTSIINQSRGYTGISLEIPLPYGVSLAHVDSVLKQAYEEVIHQPEYAKMAMDPVTISGLDRFTDVGFVLTAFIKVRPDPKKRFMRAFNLALRPHLETHGLLPPFSLIPLSVGGKGQEGL